MYIKDLAWDFVLENNIQDLKIDLNFLLQLVKQNGWRIYSYKEAPSLIEELELENEMEETLGLTYVFATEQDGCFKKEYLIFYKDELDYKEKICTIAHEIGHIVQKHTYVGGILGRGNSPKETDAQETEADLFACEFLAPSCILQRIGVTTCHEIEKVSMLSDRYAAMHTAHIHRELHDYSSGIERHLYRQFRTYITNFGNSEFLWILNKYIFSRANLLFASLILLVMLIVSNLPLFSNAPAATDTVVFEDLQEDTSYFVAVSPEPTEFVASQQGESFPGEVRVTPHGQKYHRPECEHVRDRTDTRSMTVEEAQSSGYQPCLVCKP